MRSFFMPFRKKRPFKKQFASAVADVPYVETGYIVDNAVTIPLGGVARFEYEE